MPTSVNKGIPVELINGMILGLKVEES